MNSKNCFLPTSPGLRYFWLSLLGVLLFIPTVSAQDFNPIYNNISNAPSFYPVSPEAATLFKRTPEGMDYARGRATIRIPLYEIKTAAFTLPITLNYTTGGIRVADVNGAVAIGWKLEAEPMIVREIRGEPDEQHFLTDKTEIEKYSDFFRAKVALGNADICPDMFHYRTLDTSGKFQLKAAKNYEFHPFLIDDEYVKLSVPNNVTTYNFREIDLVDNNGTQYHFGNNDTTTGCELTSGGYGTAVTTWKATDITAKDGEKIKFSYAYRKNEEFHVNQFDYYAFEDNEDTHLEEHPLLPGTPGYWHGRTGQASYNTFIGEDESGCNFVKSPESSFSENYPIGSYVSTCYISRIDFPNGYVEFLYPTKEDLREVRVYDISGKLQKSISLVKEICYDGKILLKEINMKASDNAGIEKYAFNYFKGDYGYSIYSKDVDYWGYYNGRGNTDLVPRQTVQFLDFNNVTIHTTTIGGADRSADYNASIAYALRDISYPTGGKTTYTYEPHYVFDNVDGYIEKIMGGGIRLAAITDTDIDKKILNKRKFTYYLSPNYDKDEGEGVGNMMFPFSAQQYTEYMSKTYRVEFEVKQFSATRSYTVYSSNPTDVSDKNIYYGMVIEETEGNRIVHTFNNDNFYVEDGYEDENGKWINPRFCYYSDTELEHATVHSYEKNTMYMDGDSIRRMKEKDPVLSTAYIVNMKPLIKVVNATSQSPYAPNIIDLYANSYGYTSQLWYAGIKDYATKSTLFTPQGKIQENVKREYTSPYKLLRSETQTTSAGDTYKTEYKYPFDYTDALSVRMTAKMLNNYPVERRHYKNGVLQKMFKYTYWISSETNSGYCLSSISESSNAGCTQFEDIETYNNYLSSGRPLQMTRRDGTPVCFIWGYSHQQALAVIENATLQQVKQYLNYDLETLAANATCTDAVYRVLDALRDSLSEARVTTYRYRPLTGVTEVKGPDGRSTYSDYDSAGRLQRIRDTKGHTLTEYEYQMINQ